MKLLCVLGAVLLYGCSREPEPTLATPSKAAPAPPPAQARDPRPAIACFGDSLTAGFGLELGQSYPDLLQKKIAAYRVVNFGISGDTTQDGLARMGMVIAEKPKIVVLEFGANDGLRGFPVAVTAANLEQMVVALQNAGARVVLAGITLPPNYGPEYIKKFEAVYQDLAAKYKVALIPFLLEGVGGHAELMQRDGLHPNAAGTRVVAETVYRALEPML